MKCTQNKKFVRIICYTVYDLVRFSEKNINPICLFSCVVVLLKESIDKQKQPPDMFTFARVSFLIKASNFVKKETLAQVFSCEFCKIFKNAFFKNCPEAYNCIKKETPTQVFSFEFCKVFFTEHIRVTVSANPN